MYIKREEISLKICYLFCFTLDFNEINHSFSHVGLKNRSLIFTTLTKIKVVSICLSLQNPDYGFNTWFHRWSKEWIKSHLLIQKIQKNCQTENLKSWTPLKLISQNPQNDLHKFPVLSAQTRPMLPNCEAEIRQVNRKSQITIISTLIIFPIYSHKFTTMIYIGL